MVLLSAAVKASFVHLCAKNGVKLHKMMKIEEMCVQQDPKGQYGGVLVTICTSLEGSACRSQFIDRSQTMRKVLSGYNDNIDVTLCTLNLSLCRHRLLGLGV